MIDKEKIKPIRNVKRKNHSNLTKLVNHKHWLNELFTCDEVELLTKPGSSKIEKRYTLVGSKYHPLNLCKLDKTTLNCCITYNETKKYYNEYVIAAKQLIFIESHFILNKRGYELSDNTWEEVDSLGVTRHHETDWINSIFVNSHDSASARYLGVSELGVTYDKIRARRNIMQDMFILNDPMQYFPNIDLIHPEDIDLLLRTTGNKLGKIIQNTLPEYEYILVKSIGYYENLIRYKLVEKIPTIKQKGVRLFNNDFKIKTTALGRIFIAALLPTRSREYIWYLLPTNVKDKEPVKFPIEPKIK